MADTPPRYASWLGNAGLVVGGLVLMLLVYGLVSRLVGPEPGARAATPGGDILQVEVLNATLVGGLAGQMRHYLRGEGFDVVEVGNYSRRDVAHSFVIDRVGNLEQARRVARAAGIDESRVQQEVRNDLLLDATVVIGADYGALLAFEDD